MSWFQLDSASLVQRARVGGRSPRVPGIVSMVGRGAAGFTVVSVAGFAPWAFAGRWFYRTIGEAGLYLVCALAFIGLSGMFLHKLILGSGSLSRFYRLFGVSFAAYAVAWIASWMLLRGNEGGIVGLLAGAAVMGWVLVTAFDAKQQWAKVALWLFVLNALGYFGGGWLEGGLSRANLQTLNGIRINRAAQATVAQLMWGVCYGLGFGAGLGAAFYHCQTRARALLKGSETQGRTVRG